MARRVRRKLVRAAGAGSVERDGDMWRARMPGLRKTVARGTDRDAVTATLDAATELVGASSAVDRDRTFSKHVARVVVAREAMGWRGAESDASRARAHVDADPIGALRVADVGRAEVRAWLERMLTKKSAKTKRPLGIQTVQNALNLVRAALDVGLPPGEVNPAEGVAIPRALRRARPPRAWTVLTKEELARALRAAREGERERMRVSVGTGVRLEEILLLEWADVVTEGDAPHVVVRWGGIKKGKKLPPKSGKTRVVPLFGMALDALRSMARGRAGDLVFPGKSAEVPRSKTGYHKAWAQMLARAGIARRPGLTWHVLRHTCAVALLNGWWGDPWPITTVQKLLGHASVTTTERYARLLDRALWDAAQASGGTRVTEIDTRDARETSPVEVDGVRATRMGNSGTRSVTEGAEESAIPREYPSLGPVDPHVASSVGTPLASPQGTQGIGLRNRCSTTELRRPSSEGGAGEQVAGETPQVKGDVCKACALRSRKGLEGLCYVCANERTRAELKREREVKRYVCTLCGREVHSSLTPAPGDCVSEVEANGARPSAQSVRACAMPVVESGGLPRAPFTSTAEGGDANATPAADDFDVWESALARWKGA